MSQGQIRVTRAVAGRLVVLTLLAWALVLLALVLRVEAQMVTGTRATIGPNPTPPSGSSVRLTGLGTAGGPDLAWFTAAGDLHRRPLAVGDLPSAFTRRDIAEAIGQRWSFNAGLAVGSITNAASITLQPGAGSFIGLGTATPEFPVSIDTAVNTGPAGASSVVIYGDTNKERLDIRTAGSGVPVYAGRAAGGTWALPTQTTAGQGLAFYCGGGHTGLLWAGTPGCVGFYAEESLTAGSQATQFRLELTPVGSVARGTVLVVTSAGRAQSGTYATGTTGWAMTQGGYLEARSGELDELHAKAFISDLEMALNGGLTIAKSSVVLASPFTCPALGATAPLHVRDFPGYPDIRVFAASDWVLARTFTRADADNDGLSDLTFGDCYGSVSSYVNDAANTQTWTFTRGSGAAGGGLPAGSVLAAEAVIVDYGQSGQGFIRMQAADAAEGTSAPSMVVRTWTGAPNTTSTMLRLGNLNGQYGYTLPTWGFAAGSETADNITVDPTNGLRLRWATQNRVTLNANGLALFDNTGVARALIDQLAGGRMIIGSTVANEVSIRVSTTTGIDMCVNAVKCMFSVAPPTGDITSTGNIWLGTGGNVTSAGAFRLMKDKGLEVVRASSTSFNSTNAVSLVSSIGGSASLALWQDSNGEARLEPFGNNQTLVIGDATSSFDGIATSTRLWNNGASTTLPEGHGIDVASTGVWFRAINASAGAGVDAQNKHLRPVTDADLYLGSPSYRFKNIHLALSSVASASWMVVLDPADPSRFAYKASTRLGSRAYGVPIIGDDGARCVIWLVDGMVATTTCPVVEGTEADLAARPRAGWTPSPPAPVLPLPVEDQPPPWIPRPLPWPDAPVAPVPNTRPAPVPVP